MLSALFLLPKTMAVNIQMKFTPPQPFAMKLSLLSIEGCEMLSCIKIGQSFIGRVYHVYGSRYTIIHHPPHHQS